MHVVQFLHLLSINRGRMIPQSVRCGFLLETCWWSFRAFRSFCLITNFLFFTYNYVCIFCLLQMVYMRKVLQMRRLRYWRMIIIILQCIGNYPCQSTRKGAMWVAFVILSLNWSVFHLLPLHQYNNLTCIQCVYYKNQFHGQLLCKWKNRDFNIRISGVGVFVSVLN